MRTRGSLGLLLGMILALALAGPASAATLIGLAGGNQLFTFDSSTPSSPGSPLAITGLQGGESILGIDFRPATGQLYGVSNGNRLYTINPQTGAVTQVGSGGGFSLSGASFGFDFNPVADRLRVVSDADQNLCISLDAATSEGSSGRLAYAAGDPNATQNPNVVGSAYSNNFPGATSTTLFGIDTNLDVLVVQNPDTGALNTIGSLGVDPGALLGFDVAPDGNAYFVAGFPGASFLHMVDLTTGAAPSAGTIPIGFVNGLAIVPTGTPPGAGAGTTCPTPGGGTPGGGTPGGGTPGGGTPGGGTPGGEIRDLLDVNRDGRVDLFDVSDFTDAVLNSQGFSHDLKGPGSTPGDTTGFVERMMSPLPAGGASLAQRRKAIVLGRGSATLRGGQRKRVRIPLTKAGKRFLRRYKRKRLKVTVTLTVRHTPASGTPETRTFKGKVSFRVKRKRR